MEQNKENNQNKERSIGQPGMHDEGVHGRIDGSGNKDISKEEVMSDISSVDMQEGNMNNGALGGNFDESKMNDIDEENNRR